MGPHLRFLRNVLEVKIQKCFVHLNL
jgi:hypothetical protein